MQKVDKEKAEKVLRTANENPVYQDDTIGVSIDSILRCAKSKSKGGQDHV